MTKHFGGVQAVVDFNLEVHRGEVVALVGDNAAGKSTVARMIAGVHQPDAGTILLDGSPVTIGSAQAAFGLGIATVFQELALVESLDVTSNIFLGREVTRGACSRPTRWANSPATTSVGSAPGSPT
ncbi:ATP-binding cassette domain-containing protein [Tessaracoccus coleopterorum]|uniref:ATP-binding cassette domain-containing protein n=1 Tax=Tessaracoccus coleopterorum TaxID=2714950 RepID=UPI002F910B29